MLSSLGVSGGTEDAEFEKRVQDRVASGERFPGKKFAGFFGGLVGGGGVRVCFFFLFFVLGPFRFYLLEVPFFF